MSTWCGASGGSKILAWGEQNIGTKFVCTFRGDTVEASTAGFWGGKGFHPANGEYRGRGMGIAIPEPLLRARNLREKNTFISFSRPQREALAFHQLAGKGTGWRLLDAFRVVLKSLPHCISRRLAAGRDGVGNRGTFHVACYSFSRSETFAVQGWQWD